MKWVEIAVNVSPETEDAVSNILLEHGCNGTVTFSLPESPNSKKLCGYLPVDDRLEAKLLSIKNDVDSLSDFDIVLDNAEITLSRLEDADWGNSWKEYFKPRKLGKIVIKPTWENYSCNEDEIVIELDPGMAFGTGNHETTQLCVYALQEYVEHQSKVIDAGCGSGILAMSAAKLGANSVYAFDNDPIAVRAAQANTVQNKLDSIVEVKLADSALGSPFDANVLVANIVPNILIDMAAELIEKTKINGTLILSGIVKNRVDDVVKAYLEYNTRFVEDRQMNDWSALVFKRML